MLCQEFTLIKYLVGAVACTPLYCRCWTCEECAPRRRMQLIATGIRGEPNVFLTLTVNPNVGNGPHDRAHMLAKAWKEIRRRAVVENDRKPKLKPTPDGPALDPQRVALENGVTPRQVRLYNRRLPFMAVFEKTQKGEPHLHIMARADWIGQEWLSQAMAQYMGAPIVHVERVKDKGRVATYVAKYMAKDPTRFYGCKRYWRSPDWKLARQKQDDDPVFQKGGWQRMQDTLVNVIASFLAGTYNRAEDYKGITLLRAAPS